MYSFVTVQYVALSYIKKDTKLNKGQLCQPVILYEVVDSNSMGAYVYLFSVYFVNSELHAVMSPQFNKYSVVV